MNVDMLQWQIPRMTTPLQRANQHLAEIGRVLVKRTIDRDETKTLTYWGHKYVPEYLPLAPSAMHKVLGQRYKKAMVERGANIVVRGPRGSAKSVYGSFLYPLHAACESPIAEKYILIIADTIAQSVKHIQAIKTELESNQRLIAQYPYSTGVGPVWNNQQIVTRSGLCIEALGTDSKLRGRRYGQHRPTTIIVDDAEGDEAGYSALIRSRVFEWFTKGALNAGAPATNFIVQGTMVHRDCLVSKLPTTGGWELLKWKAIRSWPERMDLWGQWELIWCDISVPPEKRERDALEFFAAHQQEMTIGAKVLWPERESLYDLMRKYYALGRAAFGSECQDEPFDPEKCEWPTEAFEGDDLWFDEWPTEYECKVITLDPSKGRDSKSHDYQSRTCLMVGSDGCFYVDQDNARRPIGEMVTHLVDTGIEFQPDAGACEAEQFQELLLPMIEDECRQKKVILPFEGILSGGIRKEVRIRRLSPYITRRRIRYKRRSQGNALLLQQLQDFPNGEHDDGPDSLEMAVRLASDLLSEIAWKKNSATLHGFRH